jgi:hypothetical protein
MDKEQKTIEQKLFTWESWDEMDTSCLHFYNCELRKDVADLPAGTKFDGIFCDHQNSLIQFHFGDTGEDYRVFKLSYNIGEDITETYKEERRLADLEWKVKQAEKNVMAAKAALEREERKMKEKVIQ